MFHVEKMTSHDSAFAVDLANTMDWNMTDEDFAFSKSLEPDGCFVLMKDLERVGIATCISYGRMGWFGNLVVKEAYRKRGAGSLLVNHAISYLKSKDVSTIGLYAYEHLVPFYNKLGFKRDDNFDFFRAKAVNSSDCDVIMEAFDRNVEEIAAFDAICFGSSRKRVFEQILPRSANPVFVVKEDGKILGYAASKVYENLAEVGPLSCSQDNSEAAFKLLNSVFSRLNGLEAFLCLPSAETTLIDLAAHAGFKKEFSVARMFLGPAVAQHCIYVAESLERG